MTSMFPVDLPPLASIQGLSRSAIVRVDLDERGDANRAAIVTSSGYAVLDDAARKATLAQTYTPQIRDCKSVAGSYRVVVDFGRGEG